MIKCVPWTDPRLAKITVLDLYFGFDTWNVRGCEGELKNGEFVFVALPFCKLPHYGFRQAIIKYAKEDGVYAKRLGIFEAIK